MKRFRGGRFPRHRSRCTNPRREGHGHEATPNPVLVSLNPRGHKLRTSERRAVSVHSDSESQAVLWVLSVDKPAPVKCTQNLKPAEPEESRNGVLHKATHPSCTPRSQVCPCQQPPMWTRAPNQPKTWRVWLPCSRCLAPHTP